MSWLERTETEAEIRVRRFASSGRSGSSHPVVSGMKGARPCALLLWLAAAVPLAAQGHGPVYGLSTPTLGRGGWSLDVAAMVRWADGAGTSSMLRPMLAYGITEDVQLSVSVPVTLGTAEGMMPARGTTRMPASRDLEALLAWRFQRDGLDVGSRFETTAYLGVDYPLDGSRAGIDTRPGGYAAVVTGYASRSVYAWGGALYRRYAPAGGGDRLGDVAMASLVLGYRPGRFRRELPHSDWRVFLEVIGESMGAHRSGGTEVSGTSGREVLLGPTVLGLFGAWGVSGGPLFPVYRDHEGVLRGDRVRLVVNTTFWF